MEILIVLLILLAIEVAIIVATAKIAESKGRSAALWGILAFVFGIIPLVIVALLPPSGDTSGRYQ